MIHGERWTLPGGTQCCKRHIDGCPAPSIHHGELVSDLAVSKFKSALADAAGNGQYGDEGIARALDSALAQYVSDSGIGLTKEQRDNTYAADSSELGVRRLDSETWSVVGSNGRRIVVRSDADGVYVGGVLLATLTDVRDLVAVLNVVSVALANRSAS